MLGCDPGGESRGTRNQQKSEDESGGGLSSDVISQYLFAPECFVAHIARRLHLLEDCVGRSQQKSECEQTKGSGGRWCRLIDELQQATVPKQPASSRCNLFWKKGKRGIGASIRVTGGGLPLDGGGRAY